MTGLWIEWTLGGITFLLAWVAAHWMRPVGGAVYALTTAPTLIPVLGGLYRAIFIDLFNISFVAKIIGMIVSASGILMIVEIARCIAPNLLAHQGVLVGLLAATTVATLGVLDRVHLMKMPDFEGSLSGAVAFFPQFAEQVEQERSRMAHIHFAEFAIIDFLIIIIGLGLSLFLADQLGLFAQPAHIASPGQGLLAALRSAQIDLGSVDPPQGVWSLLIRGFYGISLLVYTVFFLAIATNLIPGDMKSDLKGDVEAFLCGYFARSGPEHPLQQDALVGRQRWQHSFPRKRGSGRRRSG